eukprot:CAMPEP_0170388412 /NCGR_PEP_ID=MMETSP0117_2-20130122/18070_1 /TAXON_ID=400756 /ORGANISM="Durinskia baltica, Strain CSIRO CS-38" /LENGTH=75 /DNA_ID=CAMNT_0010644331 /DNA_START=130 /DNA_END=354 /DNA_ORIENTATION=-
MTTAMVAGFKRVFTTHKYGTTNFPVFFTSVAAMLARASRIFVTCDFFNSASPANVSAKAPLVMAAPFMAFIAFMA